LMKRLGPTRAEVMVMMSAALPAMAQDMCLCAAELEQLSIADTREYNRRVLYP
jgi:hypothetical protein